MRVKLVLRTWLPVAAVTTILCLLVYATVQQTFRTAANDPQIQIAEDAAVALSRGGAPGSVVPAATVDLARSLSPFTMVLDDHGGVVASSGLLHGAAPVIPKGVLEAAREHGGNAVTWQPERGVRIASVVVPFGGASPGFVLAGRSLRESERRTASLVRLVSLGWIAALAVSLIVVAGGEVAARAS